MQIFKELVAFLAEVPAWIPLILCPALAVLAAAAFALFGGRRAYPVLAGILGAAGVAFMSASATVGETLVYAALFALVACLAGLSRLAPKLKKRRRRTARDERIYEAFRAELKNAPASPAAPSPAKECCFEQAPAAAPSPELGYALGLLQTLRRGELSATDRLEADMLLRTVTAMQGRMLTEGEKNTLNDCLASVLKLTAKYKL